MTQTTGEAFFHFDVMLASGWLWDGQRFVLHFPLAYSGRIWQLNKAFPPLAPCPRERGSLQAVVVPLHQGKRRNPLFGSESGLRRLRLRNKQRPDLCQDAARIPSPVC